MTATKPRVLLVYLGVKIPPTNLKPDYPDQARAFAAELANPAV